MSVVGHSAQRAVDIRSTNMGLLSAALRNDALAWDQLCQIYGPLVYLWIRRAGVPQEDAIDLSQEVYLNVFRGLGSFRRGHGKFRAWLWRVTQNKVLDFRRRCATQPQLVLGPHAEKVMADLATPVEAEMEDIPPCILNRAVEIAAGDLRERTWMMVKSFLSGAHTAEELARQYDVTVGAVYRSVSRVKKAARGLLRDLERIDD